MNIIIWTMVIMVISIISFKMILAESIKGSFVLGNVAPTLVTAIPNQTWNMNIDNTDISLDDYFNDENGDNLTYTASEGDNPNIDIAIADDGIVTLSPAERWAGSEYVVFTASDGSFNTSSNNITLNVLVTNTAPTIQTYIPSSTQLTMTEEDTKLFSISFTDDENTSILVTWKLNETIVKQENKTLNIGGSYINTSSYSLVGNYSLAGTYSISVIVSDGDLTSTLPSWNLNVTNVNRPPLFNKTISNITVNQGESYSLDSLENYVHDPDLEIDDQLSFRHLYVEVPSNISISLDTLTNEVVFTPRRAFTGTEQIYFLVRDLEGDINYSNNVTITVNPVNIGSSSTSSTSSGGGSDICENYYKCSKWGKCNPLTNTRMRVCEDLAECRVMLNPPQEVEKCEFIASCENGWKDFNEEGIDCGGPCPSCYTCFDGIQNQGETGIDCGGPCKACATCDDGIKNCQKSDTGDLICEEGVDCGGPCEACEMFSPRSIIPGLVGSLAVLMIMGLAAVFVWKKENILEILKPKKKEKIISSEQILFKDITKIDKELNKVDKGAKSMEVKDILTVLSDLMNKIIKYKFNLGSYHTRKELVENMSQIKKDPIIKDMILNMHAKMYNMKFSGEEGDKEELLYFIKQVKIINRAEMAKFVEDKNEKNRLVSIYNLYLKRFHYMNKGMEKKADLVSKAIERKEKELKHNEINHIHSVFSGRIVHNNVSANKIEKKYKLKHKEHNKMHVFMILLIASMLYIGIAHQIGSPTGLVVYDNESIEDNNESIEEDVNEELIQEDNETTEGLNETIEEETINESAEDNNETIEENEDIEDPEEEIVVEEESEEIIEEEATPPEEDSGIQGEMGILGDNKPTFVNWTENMVLTSQEDVESTFILLGEDLDGEYPLRFSFTEDHVATKFILKLIPNTISNFNDSGALIVFTPTEEYVWDSNKVVSNYSVSIVMEDSSGSSDVILVIFNVTNTNDPPYITGYSPNLSISVAENSSQLFTYDNSTSDPDLIHPGLDSLTQTWLFDDILNNTNPSWNYSPGLCDSGTYNITLNVTDEAGLWHNITWAVTVTNTNRLPEVNLSFEGYEYISWDEDSNVLDNITLNEFFNDTDKAECTGSNQDNLTYGYEQVSIDGTNNATGVNVIIDSVSSNVSFYPSANWSGIQIIRFFANDSYGITYSDLNITLNVTNINDAPFLNSISNQSATSNQLFTLTVTATDPDNDILTYGDNSTLFNISTSNGVINFTPTEAQEGTYSILVNVSDPSGLVDETTFDLTISLGNRAPTIETIYPYGTTLSPVLVLGFADSSLFGGSVTSFNTTENITMLFNHTSLDLDGDSLNCTWYLDSVLMKNETCTNISYWNYNINFTQSGIKNITAKIDDMSDNIATSDEFYWNVTILNVNQVPIFGERTLNEYSSFDGGTLIRTNISIEPGNITLEKINSTAYYTNGSYLSPTVDLLEDYDKINITSISWIESRPSLTNVTIRIRFANESSLISTSNWSNYYTDSDINLISDGNKKRYVQFEVNMTTGDDTKTPKLESITIGYEIIDETTITGSILSWIDLDNFFSDLDNEDLNYSYEDISGSSILGLTIDTSDNTVDLDPEDSASATVIFRISATDGEDTVYSNNISLDIDVATVTTTVVTTSGGGGGSSKTKLKIIKETEPDYLQLIYVKPLEISQSQEMLSPGEESVEISSLKRIKAPIILNNTGDTSLSGIHLSATSTTNGISFEFAEDYIEFIDSQEYIETELYITQGNLISGAYSVNVIADIDDPETQDISIININPMDNLSEKVNSVMDMIKLNPICRELEEVVVKAQDAIRNKRYDEGDTLLTEAIEGCKYLVSASQKNEQLAGEKSLVIKSKGLYWGIGAFILILLLAYFVPLIINKIRNPLLFKKNKNKKKRKKI
jgi:hypothetical protein